jgi:Rrf2 family protein
MRITTWGEYGLIVGLHLAKDSGDHPLPARDIAEAEQLPPDYIEQLLLKLRRAGLVESVRGARGGYRLARSPDAITVKEVVEAAEDRAFFEVNCDVHQVDQDRCRPSTACSIRPVWRELQRRIDELLASITLADLLSREPQVEHLVTLTAAPRG